MSLFAFRLKAETDGEGLRWGAVTAFSVGLCVATGALVWLGFVTTREWSHGVELLHQRRQAEALGLVGAALNRDMKGVWTTVIVPINPRAIQGEPPYDFVHRAASAFARFPYPESFIIWKPDALNDGLTYVLNRADRRPPWDRGQLSDDPFPVTLIRNPAPLQAAMASLRRQAVSGNSFVLLELPINGVPYQIVAHFMFESGKSPALSGLAAFTVNLQWVREEYFGPLLGQVARIGGYEEALSLAVTDDVGRLVTSTGLPPSGGELKRAFPMLFLDPAAVSSFSAPRTSVREWNVHVWSSNDATQGAAFSSARQMFLLMALTAVICVLALLLTLRAIRAIALLASMKSNFVSSITHELKTPLAAIRLVGDTLAKGRYTSTEVVQEYAQLLSQKTARLSQSIDNLLIAARYSDVATLGPNELRPADLPNLIEDALESFRPIIEQFRFQVELDVPRDLPQVLVDRAAMIQVIESIIDNAIKYSGDSRALRVVARSEGRHVHVTIGDRGLGIPKEDIRRVFDRFYRGRNATAGGSGLGLAIARRIVSFHGGRIRITSTLNVGTEVDLLLIAEKPA